MTVLSENNHDRLNLNLSENSDLSPQDSTQELRAKDSDTNRSLELQLATEPFFEFSLDMLCIASLDGYLIKVNSAFTKSLGYSVAELTATPFTEFIHPDDISATISQMEKLKQGIPCIKFENRYRCRDGYYRRLQWMAAPPQDNCNIVYAIARDITESYELKQKLSWQSKHDCLTGLLNRREFEVQIGKVIDAVKNTNASHALCFLDLDRFKSINDLCGNVVGDKVLAQIATLLQQEIGESDTVARLGGDEFGILLRNYSLKKAERLAHQIREKIKEFHFDWGNKNFVLSASIGVVLIDENSLNFSSLLTAADMACYAIKDRGRNWVKVYDPEDLELVKTRVHRHWVSRLNLALERDDFCLYCQKITPLQEDIDTDRYEILLRLLDEDGKLISPMEFIPAAEYYDLMPSIDRWVIRTFFQSYQSNYQTLQSSALKDAIYTINLSGASLSNEQFFDFLKEQFAIYTVAPEKICFEITETVAIANLNKAASFINEIKDLGCSFALDDFGSGMSSLAYLKNLPIDYLKIDGNFVKNIVNDPVDRATVECFSRIGEVMNIQTIAEFVENEEIVAQLKEIGVNYAQGYGIDRPSPLHFS